MRKLLTLICVLVSMQSILLGQSAYFTDPNWQYFYIYNENVLGKAEFLPVIKAAAGNDYVAYIRNNNRFIIHTKGEAIDLNITNPTFFARDEMLAFFLDEQLWILEDGKPRQLDRWAVDDFTIGDNIVAFSNTFDKFMVYQEDSLYTVEFWNIIQAKAGDNLIAYLDDNRVFKVFYYGSKEVLETIPPISYKASKNVVAYLTNLGDFMVWHKGDIYDIQYQAPSWYDCGEDFVAYIDNLGAFSVFYEGETIELLTYKPKNIQIKDNVMIYNDDFGNLFAFYNGETIRIASFTPERVLIDKDMVVYKDNYGYLKGIYKGVKTNFSKEIAIDFDLFNHTVVYRPDKVKWVVFDDGKYYNYP